MTIPKFRVWDEVSCTMITTKDYEDLSDLFCCLNADDGFFSELMQSTGLVDWEGVEIYEGDIVKIPDDYEVFGKNAGETCKVIFDSGCFRLKTSRGRGRGFWFEDDSTVTIIGNIYENPELLEEEE